MAQGIRTRRVGPSDWVAVDEYLARARVRPVFRSAVDAVLDEHDELLGRLAR